MMRRLAPSIIAAALALAAVAPAVAQGGDRATKRWSHVTKAPLPASMPEILREPCPGAEEEIVGCWFGVGDADVYGRVFLHGAIFVGKRPSRFTVLHELGHHFDATMMDAQERDAYTVIRHQHGWLWTWTEGAGDVLVQGYGTPAEEFADAYANCRMQHTPYGLWEAGYDYYPTPREHWRVCRLIARAGRDLGTPVSPDGDR